MDLKIRLFRKPFTTVLWVTLVTAMTVLLCIGGALWYSSESVAGIIDDLHATVAYRTDRNRISERTEYGMSYRFENKSISDESRQLLEELDCVEAVCVNTLTGGYSPKFSPMLGNGCYENVDESYDDVLLVVTITHLSEPEPMRYSTYDLSPVNLGGIETTHSIEVEVHIEQYYFANAGHIGTGTVLETDTATIYPSFLRKADIEFLQEGERYLIYGNFARPFGINEPPQIQDTGGVMILDGGFLRGVAQLKPEEQYMGGYEPSEEPKRLVGFEYWDLFMAKLEGSVEDFLADPANEEWAAIARGCDIAQHSVPILGTDSLESMYIFSNNRSTLAEGRFFTPEEYESGAKVCLLSTSLAASSGISVGDTIPISQYWCVTDLANFLDNYSTDMTSLDGKLNNPTVGQADPETEFITRDEEFTVIGLYHQSNEWSNGSYDVTPNTVFIPKKAQIPGGFGGYFEPVSVTYENEAGDEVTVNHTITGDWGIEDPTWGVYFAVKVKNGMAEEFRKAIAGTDLENQFIITDQGYGGILGSIRGIAESARQLLSLIAAGWALLLLLYILLYQGMQKRNLGIMRSLGATPKESGGYLWTSGMAVAVTGIALGTAISAGVMSLVQKMLFDAATYDVPLTKFSTGGEMSQTMLEEMLQKSQLSLPMLLALAVAQITIFAAVLWLHAKWIAKKEPRILITA